MNGKITITMPMEKVPSEVGRLLGTIIAELEALAALTKSIQQQNNNHLFVINTIDEIRKRLSLVDFNYEDCYSILVGFLKYQADKRMAEMKQQEQKNDQQPNE